MWMPRPPSPYQKSANPIILELVSYVLCVKIDYMPSFVFGQNDAKLSGQAYLKMISFQYTNLRKL